MRCDDDDDVSITFAAAVYILFFAFGIAVASRAGMAPNVETSTMAANTVLKRQPERCEFWGDEKRVKTIHMNVS